MRENRDRDSESLQHQAEHTRANRRAPVAGYLVILFAVAFLLLLMAYFQQQRQNAETSDALKQSVSAVDALQKLMEDNESLRAQVDELETEVERLTEDNQSLQKEVQNYVYSSIVNRSQMEAMDVFWQLDEAYVLGRYSLCRELIQIMEEQSDYKLYQDLLPTEATLDNGRFSPADRYQEIYDALY